MYKLSISISRAFCYPFHGCIVIYLFLIAILKTGNIWYRTYIYFILTVFKLLPLKRYCSKLNNVDINFVIRYLPNYFLRLESTEGEFLGQGVGLFQLLVVFPDVLLEHCPSTSRVWECPFTHHTLITQALPGFSLLPSSQMKK